MAMAVLRGDLAAAKGLADYLVNEAQGIVLPPIKEIIGIHTDPDAYRVALFIENPDVEIDRDLVDEAVESWLRRGGTLVLQGISRIEIYKVR